MSDNEFIELRNEYKGARMVFLMEGKKLILEVECLSYVGDNHKITDKQIEFINKLRNVNVYRRVKLENITKQSAFVIINIATRYPDMIINVKKLAV